MTARTFVRLLLVVGAAAFATVGVNDGKDSERPWIIALMLASAAGLLREGATNA